jgi:CHAD domain-containing protein
VRASTTRLKIKLRAALDGTKRWLIKSLKERDLRCGITRSHHRFLKAYEKAKKSPSIGNLHELRKRTKDLTYQLDMIKWLNAISIGKFLWKLTQVGKNLGDDHDLALLEINAAKFNPHLSKEFQRSVRFRRAELQQSAFELGRKLSTIKPAVFDHLIKK